MENTAYSARLIQQRKFYMILPVLVLPFITLIYWVLFVKGAKMQQQTIQGKGLLMSLPDAMLKEDKELNKLSFYQRAAADSAKLSELIRKDPYRSGEAAYIDSLQTGQLAGLGGPFSRKEKPVSYRGRTYTAAGEEKIFKKLTDLDAALSRTAHPEFSQAATYTETSLPDQADQIRKQQQQMEHLHTLMANLQQPQQQKVYEDPEIRELNTVLDKIIRIQSPELAAPQTKEQSQAEKDKVFSARQTADENPVSLLSSDTGADSLQTEAVRSVPFEQSGFLGLDHPVSKTDQNAIPALIAQDQTLVSGSTVRLSLTQDIYLAGVLIPKDSYVYGIATLNSERLIIRIETIRFENNLLPVKLSVYDLDGIAGIHIPGAIARDVAKQSLSQDIEGITVSSLDASLGAQAASAAVQTAKTLMGKKTRLLQVVLRAGYQVLLRDGNAGS